MPGVSTVAVQDLRTPIDPERGRLTKSDLSQVISFSRISLIVGLVFLHYGRYPNVSVSPFGGINSDGFQIATFVNSFVLFFFFSVVPLLSMVSGWLFFSFDTDATSQLASRIRRRLVSLYAPLALWNLLYLVVLAALFVFDRGNPLLTELNIDFATAQPIQYVNAVFAFTQHPIGFQFWFVRDLFVTVLLSPILWALLRYAPVWGVIGLAVVWLTGFDLWIFFRTDVPFFFYLGGLLRLRRTRLEIEPKATLWLLIAYVLLVSLRTVVPHFVADDEAIVDVATRAMRLVGVLACWGVFQQVALTGVGAAVASYGGFAFFLHAIHFPLIAAVKIVLWSLVPAETQIWMLVHYAMSVLVTVSVGIGFGLALTKLAPRPFAFLNGGRPAA